MSEKDDGKNWSDFEHYLIRRIDKLELRLSKFEIKVYSFVFIFGGIVEGIKYIIDFKK